MALPSSVCLKSVHDNNFLRLRSDDGFLQSSGETITDPFIYFDVEKARNWPDLYHLKLSYTNQYLCRNSATENWITVTAEQPNEELTSWSCTCFRPFFEEDNADNVRFVHVQLGNYVRIRTDAAAPFTSCLDAQSRIVAQNSTDLFTLIDLGKVSKIPRNVAVIAENGYCLGPGTFLDRLSLQFSPSNSPNDLSSKFEMIPADEDGNVYIRSLHYGKFWRVDSTDTSWIIVDANDPSGTNMVEALFKPSVDGVNVITLLSVSRNNRYCKRYTTNTRLKC